MQIIKIIKYLAKTNLPELSPKYIALSFLLIITFAGNVFAETLVPSTITTTTWTSAGNPYLVNSNVTIPANNTLTIDPGVVVQFTGNYVMTVSGVLNVQGLAGNEVTFTSTNPTKGSWDRIEFYYPGSTNSVIDHAIIEYGGSTGNGCLSMVRTSPSIKNSTISNCNSYVMRLDNNATGSYPYFENNTYINNDINLIKIIGIYYDSGTLKKAGIPYYIEGDGPTHRIIIHNAYGATALLTINPGVEIHFGPGARIEVGYNESGSSINGGINIQGTEAEPVKLTSSQPEGSRTQGYWWGLKYVLGSFTVNHAIIEYADYAVHVPSQSSGIALVQNSLLQKNNYGIFFQPVATVNATNNTIIDNIWGVPAGCNSYNPCNSTINFNSIYNNTYNVFMDNYGTNASSRTLNAEYNWWGTTDENLIKAGIRDFLDENYRAVVDYIPYLDGPNGNPIGEGTTVPGTIDSTRTWTKANSPYIVVGDTVVNSGVTLTMEPGVTVKFNGNYKFTFNGNINAQGTAAENVIFTSNKLSPAKGDWQYIEIKSSSGNTINYVKSEYAQRGIYLPAASGSTTIQNSTFQNNNYGVYFESTTSPSILNSSITNNDTGIYANCPNGCSSTINNNIITGNTYMNFDIALNAIQNTLNAENNWWGSTDFNTISSGIIDYLDDTTKSAVDAFPYLDGPGGNPTGGQYVYGFIRKTETWGTDYSPYHIKGNTSLSGDKILTVSPGVQVRFDGNYYLNIDGIINAQGTEASPILFTSDTSTSKGSWQYIRTGNSSSRFNYVTVQYADTGIDIPQSSGGVTIENSILQENNRGINIGDQAGVHISNNLITNNLRGINAKCSLLSGICPPVIEYNQIYDNIEGTETNNIRMEGNASDSGNTILVAENNWWGSTDANTIAATIFDHTDTPFCPIVDFAPYLSNSPSNSVYITNVSTSPRFFKSRLPQSSTINYTIDKDANVTIKIYAYTGGALVRTLIDAQAKLAGANADIWDGKDDAGEFLADGVYTFTIEAQTTDGKSGIYNPVSSNEVPPIISNVTVTPNTNFNPYKGDRLQISYNLDMPAIIKIGNIDGIFIVDELRDAGTNVDYWNGRKSDGEISGVTYIDAITSRLPENIMAIQNKPALDVTTLATDPFVIRPIYSEITNITYTINEEAAVTVSIVSQDGSTVLRTLTLDEAKSAGTYALTWDGKTDAGEVVATSGDYRVRVKAVDSNGAQVIRDGNIRIFE